MADYPYFPLYVEDLAMGTAAMSPTEFGIYVRCLGYQWSHGYVPNDRDRVARLAGASSAEVDDAWTLLSEKLPETSPGRLQNARLEKERVKLMEMVERRSEAGRAGARARYGSRSADEDATASANELQPHSGRNGKTLARVFDSDSDSDSECNSESQKVDKFAVWWSTVPHRTGKQAAAKAYRRAVQTIRGRPPTDGPGGDDPHAFLLERMQAFAQTPKAKGEFCPHPATWLNQGRYDDDPATWQSRSGSNGDRPVIAPRTRSGAPIIPMK